MLMYVADALAAVAIVSTTAAVFGMVRARNVYVRIRAASLLTILGVLPLILATSVSADGPIIVRALLLGTFLLFTTVVTSHAVTRLQVDHEHDKDRPRDDV